MKHISIIAAFAVLSVLTVSNTSCGIYGKYKTTVTEQEEALVLPSYKDIFLDGQLTALIDTALKYNPDLEIAHRRVLQADAQLTAAKLAYLPHFNLGGNPAVQLTATNSGINSITYSFGSADWEIDIFGRLTNRKRIAGSTRDELADYEQAARCELIAAIATTYFNLQTLDAQIEAADSAEANWKRSVETMKSFKISGNTDEDGVAQFEGSYYATRSSAKELRRLKEVTLNEMRRIIGKEGVQIQWEPLRTDGTYPVNMDAVNAIDLRAVRVRPDVRAAEMQLAKAFYNVNLARANCCPSISISGVAGWANTGIIYNAIGGLLQPLFNSGQNIMQVKAGKQALEEYKINYTKALMKAGTAVNNAIISQKSYMDQAEDKTARIYAMARALEASQLKMKYGRGTYLEILIAQNNLLEAQLAQIRNTGDIMISTVDLFQALGGGKQ